jgi:hypothetical protein
LHVKGRDKNAFQMLCHQPASFPEFLRRIIGLMSLSQKDPGKCTKEKKYLSFLDEPLSLLVGKCYFTEII